MAATIVAVVTVVTMEASMAGPHDHRSGDDDGGLGDDVWPGGDEDTAGRERSDDGQEQRGKHAMPPPAAPTSGRWLSRRSTATGRPSLR